MIRGRWMQNVYNITKDIHLPTQHQYKINLPDLHFLMSHSRTVDTLWHVHYIIAEHKGLQEFSIK